MMKTKRLTIVTCIAAALLLFSSAGWTADDDAEATIRLMGAAEADLPDAVTKLITIPTDLMQASEEAQQRAVANSAKGLEKANQRIERRESNRLHADEARDRKAEMSDSAREDRENRGRAEDPPEPPNSPPEGPPGRP